MGDEGILQGMKELADIVIQPPGANISLELENKIKDMARPNLDIEENNKYFNTIIADMTKTNDETKEYIKKYNKDTYNVARIAMWAAIVAGFFSLIGVSVAIISLIHMLATK
jgi:hypothetical protein